MFHTTKALAAASALLLGVPTAVLAQPGVLPSGYVGTVTGNTPNTWQTYTYNYTPSTSGANFVGFAFRQDPAFWTFDNVTLYAPGSNVNLLTNGSFTNGGAFSVTTNNGPSQIQAPTNWGVWYQNGTYPAAAGTWSQVGGSHGGVWYDGAVGTFDGIYQGVNLTAGTQYTISFEVSGNNTANTSSIQLGAYAGLCQDTTIAAASCTIPSSYGFTTLATPAQGAAAGAPAVTVTGTSTANQVTTTTSAGTRTVSGTSTRSVIGVDVNGYQTESYYTDSTLTTIPTTTTTTTTTPVTTTTYSDGSTTTSNGTPVVSSVTTDDNTGTTVVTQATTPDWIRTRTYDVQRSAFSPSAAPTIVNTPAWTPSESNGKQHLNLHVITGVTTPTARAVTITAIYTQVYTDGVTPDVVTNDTPVVTYETSSTYDEYHTYRDWYGRVDQLEVLDGVSGALNGLLDHEPMTNHKKRFRVFENTRFAQSYNADEYNASSRIIGGGFEYDLTKGWTAGAQYNDLYTEMLGVDSISHLKRQHVGVFNSFHGKNVALVTNAGWSQDQYDYARTLEFQFGNWGKTEGNQWWIHNRLYVNNSGWFKPFVGYTISNVKRNAYDETGSPESARSVGAFNQTTHVGEVGLKLETRFGGKKHDVFGISVDGSYGTDNSYGITGSLDYKEVLFVEGSYGVADGVITNSVAGKVKFRF